ncbi:hypothetical protein DICPUDRAFT_76639 [Dictyostelium purpureum]|uniref:OB domain-containing protein n=1 Tax=Dictyostelium purpureum TaxID=5786 RepID=F0ZE43_DICPU|nr:uncharacterized protein DICPUDRAFT_76639 [Dictyostelium purpureum]EGC37761.1 hypothetical protein DICPUDRAFT_76639 [Dictyostelium purpureum]|eukprot:XP_003285700.1 hypothetical protein DICPUDRAFT_76639 [Dictyostelium purpureum]
MSTFIKVNEIKPYTKNINCVFIVLDKGLPTKKKEGTIFQVLVADSSAAINMTLWDVIGEQVQPGDILRLKGGYSNIYIDLLNLYVGKTGLIEKIGEFTFPFVEAPNLSATLWNVHPDPNNPKNMVATPKIKSNPMKPNPMIQHPPQQPK